MNSNPFTTFANQIPPALVGREREVQELMEGITEQVPRSFQIAALRTMGATALLRYMSHPEGACTLPQYRRLLERLPHKLRLRFIYIDCVQFNPKSFEAVSWLLGEIEARARQLDDIPIEEQAAEQTNRFERVYRLLGAAKQSYRLVIILDHFDRLLHCLAREEAVSLRPFVAQASVITSTERALAEINDDAASSLFGGQPAHVTLNELDREGARELLRAALQNSPEENEREYLRILRITGLRPYYILHGAAVWFEMKTKYKGLPPKQILELFPDTMLARYRLDFVHFWNHISEREKESLYWLVENNSVQQMGMSQAVRQSLINLMDKGLVNWDRQFEPFSQLWRRFIEEKRAERDITPPPRREHTRSREEALRQYLQKHPGEICTYEQILDAVWQLEDDRKNRHLLRQSILKLRQLMDDEPNHGDRIVNHRNRGYEYRTE